MTTENNKTEEGQCPAEGLLKLLSGKWKPQIFRLAVEGPLRFNTLLKQISGSNKQTIAVSLKELEKEGLLERNVIRLKPLHVEYILSERGRSMIAVFRQIETLT